MPYLEIVAAGLAVVPALSDFAFMEATKAKMFIIPQMRSRATELKNAIHPQQNSRAKRQAVLTMPAQRMRSSHRSVS